MKTSSSKEKRLKTEHIPKEHPAGKRNDHKKDPALETLLKQYTPPEIHPDIRRSQITQLSADIRHMDYLPRQSFAGQILTQLSFVSGWVWLAQAGILFLVFYYVFRTKPLQLNMLLFCLAPGLSLIMIYELSKSFRSNIWEMEAACRYDLAQIFLFRLCILFGGDFLVLAFTLIAYQMVDGLLWQFCYYALLPFFLTSAVSLYFLRRFGNRCSSTVTAAVPLLTGLVLPMINRGLMHSRISLSRSIPVLTILAFFFLLYNALKLCTKMHYLNENRKDHNLWNFE